jgi:hypothetical protein
MTSEDYLLLMIDQGEDAGFLAALVAHYAFLRHPQLREEECMGSDWARIVKLHRQ